MLSFKQYIFPFIAGSLFGFALISLIQVFRHEEFLNPLFPHPAILAAKVPSKKPIIGFLPYWTLNTSQIQYHLLDYLCYFSVGFNVDGSIKKMNEEGHDIGWLKLQSDELKKILEIADKQEVGRMIAFTAFNNELIDTFIGNPKTKQRVLDSIINIVKEYKLDAVNIDFEYHTGYPVTQGPDKYVLFIKDLREELSINGLGDVLISVDLYANAFINSSLYDSAKLAEVADWLVLMGYDFHQARSNKAGPVAPLKSLTGRSITEALNSALKNKIKTDKIVLAMPFYGYEWQTDSEDFNASAYPNSGAMASYRYVNQLIKDKKLKSEWNNQSMSPWLSYKEDGNIYQIYYENDQSIGYKLQLISQLQLQGAAIWALGYEGLDAPVWNVIEDWRKQQN